MSNVGTQFKKGQSGNPKGPPLKEWTMGSILREALNEQDETGTPYKVTLIRKLRGKASKGDMVAMKEIINRIDGLPLSSVDVTSRGEKLEAPHIILDVKE